MAARKKTPNPEPVAVTTICSVCGLSWSDHGAEPTTDDCIRLLKAELAKKPDSHPYPVPYPVPYYPRPYWWREWYNRPWCEGNGATYTYVNENHGLTTFRENTPKLLTTTCQATTGSSL